MRPQPFDFAAQEAGLDLNGADDRAIFRTRVAESLKIAKASVLTEVLTTSERVTRDEAVRRLADRWIEARALADYEARQAAKRKAHFADERARKAADVAPPGLTDAGCWVLVRRYVGSLAAQHTHCGNRNRPGHRTCARHQAYEAAAQEIGR